jgi:nucleoid-associated protein YgaU
MNTRRLAVGSGAVTAAIVLIVVWAWPYLFPARMPAPAAPHVAVTAAAPPPAPVAPPSVASPAAPPAPPPAAAPPTAANAPTFDVVRVERSGDAVIAGRAPPNSTVDLTADGKVVAEAQVDANGNFVLVPSLPPGAYELGLRMLTPGAAPVVSAQSVTVSVPAKAVGAPVVALNEPGKPTKLLADPTAPAAGAAPSGAARPPVAVKTAEVQQGGGFLASGTAEPGAHLRLYLNGSLLADVTAAPDGAWSVTVGTGMTPGHYAVRADALDAAGKVVARAEVPFEAPALPATTPPAGQTAAVAAAQPSAAVVKQIGTATVQPGDSLWVISRKILGSGIRYTQIYAANTGQIRDPNLIYPGQIFVVPGQNP